jgi:hypothetical protein
MHQLAEAYALELTRMGDFLPSLTQLPPIAPTATAAISGGAVAPPETPAMPSSQAMKDLLDCLNSKTGGGD